ncbi:hypothetical protein J6590_029961 [Homalodisca vitripennis]|nr:hypothetical protein J6590_029961 [Homalodisca vitripennis]
MGHWHVQDLNDHNKEKTRRAATSNTTSSLASNARRGACMTSLEWPSEDRMSSALQERDWLGDNHSDGVRAEVNLLTLGLQFVGGVH